VSTEGYWNELVITVLIGVVTVNISKMVLIMLFLIVLTEDTNNTNGGANQAKGPSEHAQTQSKSFFCRKPK